MFTHRKVDFIFRGKIQTEHDNFCGHLTTIFPHEDSVRKVIYLAGIQKMDYADKILKKDL